MYPSTAPARTATQPNLPAAPQQTITTTQSGIALTTTTTTTATTITSPSASAPKMTSLPADRSQLAKLLVNAELTGMSALHHAIFHGDYDMALTLIDAGSYIGSTIQLPTSERINFDSLSPAFAIAHANEMIRVYKSHKELEDDSEESYIEEKMALPLTQQKIVEFALYLANLAPSGCIEVMGANALTLSVLRKVPHDFIKKLFEAAARQHPALINAPDRAGRTPLGTAVAQGDLALIKLLLELGTDPNRGDGQGRTPLAIAAWQGDAKIVELLLKHGAESSISPRARRNLTALGCAIINGHTDVALQIIAHGVPVNIYDEEILSLLFTDVDLGTRPQPSSNHEPSLMFMYGQSTCLALYAAQSQRHHTVVQNTFRYLFEEALDSDAPESISKLLATARTCVSNETLITVVPKITSDPGKFAYFDTLLTLLEASKLTNEQHDYLQRVAASSGNAATLERAVSLDSTLQDLLSWKAGSTPNPLQAKLNRLLVLGMQAGSKTLIRQASEAGATIALTDSALKDLPVLAILCDHGDEALLNSVWKHVGRGLKKKALLMLEASIKRVTTATGMQIMLSKFRAELSQLHLNHMLVRAVVLNDETAIDLMIKAGAKPVKGPLAAIGQLTTDLPSRSAVKEAIKHQNLSVLEKLLNAGGTIDMSEIQFAKGESRKFARRVSDLMNAYQ